MSSPSMLTNEASTLASIAQAYFDSLADGNFGRTPWFADIVLRTPLYAKAPLEGRSAVEAFFRPMVGQLGTIRLVETYVNRERDVLIAEAYVGPLHVFDKFLIRDGQIVEQENVFDPRPVLDASVPGGMSADERALLLDMLEASRDRLRADVQSWPEEAWHRTPAGGGWSPAECAEHLVLSEEALLAWIAAKFSAPPPLPLLSSN